jgi:hypothetical protein
MDDGSPISRTTQKSALYYVIKVDAPLRNAPVQPLSAIVKAFASASEKGEAVWREGANAFEIARVRFNKTETRAVLLVRYTGPSGALNSAHAVVDLILRDGAYRAVIEEAPALSKARLEFGMEALSRRLCEAYVANARGQFKKTHPRLSFVTVSEPIAFDVERASEVCEPDIRPDVSVKLDGLLKRFAQAA